MLEWTPHLKTLLGDSNRARIQISQTLTLENALRKPSLPIGERLRIIAMIRDLDSLQQVLLTPVLMESVSSPSRAVRRQVLELTGQLVADKEKPLRDALISTFEHRHPESALVRLLLGRLEESVSKLIGQNLEASFAELLRVRPHVFVLSTLLAVTRWARASDDIKIRTEFDSHVIKNENIIDSLGIWLTSKNLLLRYLLVKWMAETGESLIEDQPTARTAFLHLYANDDDPLVAGAAVERFAALADVGEVESTLKFLTWELQTLESRRLKFSGMTLRHALTQITTSLITALGEICRTHIESDNAMDALSELVEMVPCEYLNLLQNLGRKGALERFTKEQNLNIFRAAMYLRREEILVNVRKLNDREGQAGFDKTLLLEDPNGILLKNPACRFYWVRAQSGAESTDPVTWRYTIEKPSMEHTRHSCELRPLISPLLNVMSRRLNSLNPSNQNFWKSIAGRELDDREAWMRAGWKACTTIITCANNKRLNLGSERYRQIVLYVANMAVGINRVPYNDQAQIQVRRQLKDLITKTLLNELAYPKLIDLLFPGRDAIWELEAQLITDMAVKALSSFPGEPTRTWLHDNVQRLQKIAATERKIHMRVRGQANAILHLHREILEPQQVLDDDFVFKHLPEDDTFQNCESALICILDTGLLKLFERNIGSWEHAGDVVNASNSRDRNRCRRLIEELLARELKASPFSPAAEHAAAACLSWQDEQQKIPLISRLRLLQAYARCDLNPEGSVRRLLDHLLRNASSVELDWYLNASSQAEEEREGYGPQFDEVLVLRLIRFLHEPEDTGSHTWQSREVNMHALRDKLQRRPTILRELARQAHRFGDRFEYEYRKMRAEQTRTINRAGLVSAFGTVLQGPEGVDRIYAVLKTDSFADEKLVLTTIGCNHLSAFTWYPRFSSEVRCLTHFTPVPVGALDFHSLSMSPQEKTALLMQKLNETSDPLVLCGRVVDQLRHSAVLIDLGVMAPSLEARHVIDINQYDKMGSNPSVDDVIIVELVSSSGVNLYASKAFFKLYTNLDYNYSSIAVDPSKGSDEGEASAMRMYDLRGSKETDALSRLQYLNESWQREGKKFGLWAKVCSVTNDKKNSEHVRWFLDCGFRYRINHTDVQPSISVSRELAVPEGPIIVIPHERSSIRFEREQTDDKDCVTYRILPFDRGRLNPVHPVSGYLLTEQDRYGRRRWFGLIAGQSKLPVNRSDLTVDLETLYALDALPDGHKSLKRLQSEEVYFVAVNSGTSLSLRHMPPFRNQADLLILIQAGQVEYLTYNYRAASDELIFEVTRSGGVANEHQRSLPVLGYLVTVSEDLLFDQQGRPVDASQWELGDRIYVSVQMCAVNTDGTLGRRDTEFAGAWPQLLLIGEVQKLRRQCIDALRTDASIRVRVVQNNSKVQLELMPGCLPEILPLPTAVIAADYYTKFTNYEEGQEIDAAIAEELVPDAIRYQLSVKTLYANEIRLENGREAIDVAKLINLCKGSIINRTPKIINTQSAIGLSTAGLWVTADPLLFWLLPNAPDTIKTGTLDHTGIRISKVEERKNKRAWVVDTENLPDIPGLGDSAIMIGIVTSVPPRRREQDSLQSSQVGIRWIGKDVQGHADETAYLSGRWSFNPGIFTWKSSQNGSNRCEKPQINLGDLFQVELTGTQLRFNYQNRRLYGTFMHQPILWEDWIHNVYANDIWGLLLRKGKDDLPWLFSFSPGSLVEIPTSKLLGINKLEHAWQLDRVRLLIERSGVEGVAFEVMSCNDGTLHSVIGKKLTLNVESRQKQHHMFHSTLHHSSFGAYPLSLDLKEHELPSGFDAGNLTKVERFTKEGTCTLMNYSLDIEEETTGYDEDESSLTFSIHVNLDRFVTEQKHTEKIIQKVMRSLMHELDIVEEGRIDIPNATLLQQADGYAIRLSNYEPSIIPLPENELTWIPMIEVSLSTKRKLPVTVVKSDTGPVASLRLNRPKSLEEWLKEIGATFPGRIVDNHRFMYYGELKEDDLRQLGLEYSLLADSDDDEDYMHGDGEIKDCKQKILLELEPGYTVVALVSQILFLGEPLRLGGKNRGDSGLYTGDTILEFRIEKKQDNKPIQINILRSVPDIRYQVENFTRQKGILFGEVSLDADDTISLKQFYGADHSGQKPHRIGKWNKSIEKPTEEQLAIVSDLRPGEFVYLKFVRADDEKGVLWFRVLTPDEVFNEKNLIYVKPLGVSPFGQIPKLDVQPLVRMESGTYFIPDTQYSQRTGALRTYQNNDLAHICLASVYERGVHHGKPSTKLSLKQTPSRKFAYLMTRADWRGSVTHVSRNGFTLELSPGTRVDIPFENALINEDNLEQLKGGAFVILDRERNEWKIRVRDILLSQFDYLPEQSHPWFFVKLWAEKKQRRKWFDNKNGVVNCSITGYPQLSGLGRIQESDLYSSDPLPLAFKGISPDRQWVELAHSSTQEDWVAGKLHICENGTIELFMKNKDRLQFNSNNVSYFFGSSAECQKHLKSWKWWNDRTTEKKEPPETIYHTQVIARRAGNRVSLTEFADLPCPVDHLIEQYPVGVTTGHFIVARSEPGRLILEVAPGRYVELPTVLIEPLHSEGKLRDGLVINWELLGAGDEIILAMIAATRSRDTDILPNFLITRVIPSKRRMLRTPLVTIHMVLPDGSRVLGVPGAEALPADMLPPLIGDMLYNLADIDKSFTRYQKVKCLFEKYSSRLVLKGRVIKLVEKDNFKSIAYIDIGVKIPISNGRQGDLALIMRPHDLPLHQNDEIHVRVLNAEFNNQQLVAFDYRVERMQNDENRQLVRVVDEYLFPYFDLPQLGDSVFVVCPNQQKPSILKIVGYEAYSIVWVDDENDSLNLHNSIENQIIVSRLLDNPSRMLAATVEIVNGFERTVTLSRRNQLDSIRLDSKQVLRGQILLVLSQNRLLVNIFGVPVAMRTEDFCQGGPLLKTFADEIEKTVKGRGCEIEIAWQSPRTINNSDLYQPLSSLPVEFDSHIEFVTESGLTAMAGGIRYFVPRTELAWCRLDAPLVRTLFSRGQRLALRATNSLQAAGNNTVRRTSHIDIHDIRSQVAQMLYNRHEPLYVTIAAMDREAHLAIVLGQSGVLMELHLEAQTSLSVGDRLPAYVHNIDGTRRVVVLTQEDRPLEQLNLPVIEPKFSADLMSTELIKARLEDLRAALRSHQAPHVVNWLQNQSCLEPGPRTVRCILSIVHEAGLGSSTWWDYHVSQASGNSPFLELWRDFSAVLKGDAEKQSVSPGAKFAMGYQCLLGNNDYEEAARWFESLGEHPKWSKYFDTQLCLAQIDRLRSDETAMTRRLKELLSALFSNALRTIVPPLTAPSSEPEFTRKLSLALATGDPFEVQKLADTELRRAPGSPHVLLLQIWSGIAHGRRDEGIIRLLQQFLYNTEAEREASRLFSDIDPRWSLWAAWFCFTRGRIADGWHHLEEMRLFEEQGVSTLGDALGLARVWYAWLADRPLPAGTDRMYLLLFELFRKCRWRAQCNGDLFDEFWNLYMNSLQRWTLDIPICRAVSYPRLDSLESLAEWCMFNNCPELNQSLSIEVSEVNDSNFCVVE